jgi:hypothetical protein
MGLSQPCCAPATAHSWGPRRPGVESPGSRTLKDLTGRRATHERENALSASTSVRGAARHRFGLSEARYAVSDLIAHAGPLVWMEPTVPRQQHDGQQRCLLHDQQAIYSLVPVCLPGGLAGTGSLSEGGWWGAQIGLRPAHAPEAASVEAPAVGVHSPSSR